MSNEESAESSLKMLRVIDRLEVGPVRIEPRRIVAPYTVWQYGQADSFDLIFRYDRKVFEEVDDATSNLACMIAAQLAINYGLFCNEIFFHGLFDADDRRFIRETAANTAREIYVKKFLEPNPFLTGLTAEFPVVRKTSYLKASLTFEPRKGSVNSQWETDKSRVAVLSSGGKDSLLSFALFQEIGADVYPIFGNESGRHWFTALNAYRHFARAQANTTRVWTNSDRLFSWILRHLPFVRPDFARMRADEYPIQLWTVALFVFGVLPLLREHGIARLVIGDEFDTTDRRTHAGITHYNGLYDQSRFFDAYLTRYFQAKSWNVTQFSVLRPLSELLIEKVLVERYPQLQRFQVSCHAAHTVNQDTHIGRVRPCGKCEKCTRIVGMLKGLGADPTHCGYSPEQIDRAMLNLAARGAMQENAGLEHLAFLLVEKGLIAAGKVGTAEAREHPEIMKLRFDPQRSPITDVPADVRRPLYSILLQHAYGAVQRVGKVWKDFDLMSDSLLH